MIFKKCKENKQSLFHCLYCIFTSPLNLLSRRSALGLKSLQILLGFLVKQRPTEPDRGDITQIVIIIAGFASVAIAVIGWISTALFGVGADTSKCITSYGQGVFHNISQQCYNEHAFKADDDINCDTNNRLNRNEECGLLGNAKPR